MLIKTITLTNFKCFKSANFNLSKINILVGLNNSGKTSLIDAILSAMQTKKFPLTLDINGKYKDLGGFTALSHGGNSETIGVNIHFSNIHNTNDEWKVSGLWKKAGNSALPQLNKLNSVFTYAENKTEFTLTELSDNDNIYNYKLKSGSFNSNYSHTKQAEQDIIEKGLIGNKELPIPAFDKKFNYIHSFREEPNEQYKQATAKDKIDPSGKGFAQQIAEWEDYNKQKLGELSKALKQLKLLHSIKTQKRDDGTFKLMVKVHENSPEVPLTAVGYGVSKILPLLVADLQLPEYSLLAASEPEIDLHPSVQADFAQYIAAQSQAQQKQYLIETHSEYILNRLRLLISKGKLKEEDVKVYYFENNGNETTTHKVSFLKTGEIQGAPDSFFETYEADTINIALNSMED